MSRFNRRIPANESPEQKRVREDREEIANARVRSIANRGLSQYKSATQEDWNLSRGSTAAKASA